MKLVQGKLNNFTETRHSLPAMSIQQNIENLYFLPHFQDP